MLSREDLLLLFKDSGFRPGRKHFSDLVLHALTGEAEDERTAAAKLLARAGEDGALALAPALRSGDEPVGAEERGAEIKTGPTRRALEAFRWFAPPVPADVVERLGVLLNTTGDARVRLLASRLVGRFGLRHLDEALIALLPAAEPPLARVILESLGKLHTARAAEAVAGFKPEGAQVKTAHARAALMVKRRPRQEGDAPQVANVGDKTAWSGEVVLSVRTGLEAILCEELTAHLPAIRFRQAGTGRVVLKGSETISSLYRCRTFLRWGLQQPTAHNARDIAKALEHPSFSWLASLFAMQGSGATSNPEAITYRVALREGSESDAVSLAAGLSAALPGWVNDPRGAGVTLALVPGGIEVWPRVIDPRFSYRTDDVSAASHPTVAAALAWVAGTAEGDVVWDPFVGSGLELCERSLRGSYARLCGTDKDGHALSVAREHLARAGAHDVDLRQADAIDHVPPAGLSLLISNPPLGRRSKGSSDIGAFLDRIIQKHASALVRGGRWVWISPAAGRTARAADRMGLDVERQFSIDMGGFGASVQAFRKR